MMKQVLFGPEQASLRLFFSKLACDIKKSNVDRFWEISIVSVSLQALAIEKDPYMVHFFEPTASAYSPSDLKFDVLSEYFVKRMGKIPR